jgi:NAD(P)-dependent dehydrogenase (short-subunit alcohol dehydrogenase family)
VPGAFAARRGGRHTRARHFLVYAALYAGMAAVAVITGAPSCLGFNFTRKLLARRSHALVLLAVRDAARGDATLAALRAAGAQFTTGDGAGASPSGAADVVAVDAPLPCVVALPCNLASLASVAAFCDAVAARTPRVHLLVLNAGVTAGSMFRRATDTSADGYEATFAINHLAHFLIARTLLPQLRAARGARVVVTASVGHKNGAVPSEKRGGWRALATPGCTSYVQAYFNSKLANVAHASELQRRFGAEGVSANALHPGGVRDTGIWRVQTGLARLLIDDLMFPLGNLLGV